MEKQVVKLSVRDLVEVLKNVENPTFVSMVSDTPVKMNQYLDYWLIDANGKKTKNPNPTKNPYYELGVRNISRKYKIITGFDYENAVNGRREKEGKEADFQAKENWFEFVSKGLVTDKKTHEKFYFRYQYLNDSILETEYKYDGNAIDKMMFEAYMQSRSDYANQELDNPLQFQVCQLDNIRELTMNGTQYIIE